MGGGGGKGGTSTSTVSIPPEVLARYNSVNARAEEVAKQPFQSYGGEFVAPLTQTQQQGVSQTQDYSQAAQPYYQTAAGMTGSAAQAVQPYYGAAAGITGAALAGAQPYYGVATGITNAALAGIQPNYQQAYGMTTGAANAAQPNYQQALGMTTGAANAAQPNYQQAYGMTTGSANAAQPLYGAAELQTLMAGQPLSPQQIQQYQNPFVQSVVDPTLQALRQQQGIDLSRQQAQQIQSGAYGGDRAGLSRAMLQGQQGLAQAQAISPLYQSAYQNALQAAQQQQQVGLAGAQQLGSLASQQLQGQLSAGQQLGALTGQQLQGQLGAGQQLGTLAGQQLQGQLSAGQQLGALTGQQYTNALSGAQQLAGIGGQQYTNALAGAQQLAGIGGQQLQGQLSSAQQLAGIGTGAQQAGLQGAQAVIGAGTLGQQTQQAQDTAQYQQFLQQRGYDFQTAQFLANIAEGTGALSGSTTTSTQPTSFFSDERLKHDIKKIGKTNDGQPIYSFKYNGDDRTQIGLLAQEVEKKHPEAVGLSGGYKTVDYAKATAGARHARAMGGLVPESMGGAVFEPGNFARGGYVGGGLVNDPNDIQAILAAQKQSMGPFGQSGLYGGSSQQDPHGTVSGYVPKATLPVPKLVTSSFQPKQQQGGLQSAMQDINAAGKAAETLSGGWDAGKKGLLGSPATDKTAASSGLLGAAGKYDPAKGWFGDDVPKAPDSSTTSTKIDADGKIVPLARGGVVPRHHFASGGPEDSMQDDFTTPGLVKEDKVDGKENRANVPASGFPTDVLSSGTSAKELAVAKNPSTSGGQSGMSSLAQGLGAANNALKAGKSISTMLGGGADAIGGGGTFAAGMGPFMSEAGVGAAGAGAAEGAGILGGLGSAIGSIGQAAMAILPFFGLSDARLKDNIKQVGKTFDGQNIYSYDMGDGRTQMGLLAQEVLHHKPEAVGEKQGYLTVDYRKATEDSALHRAAGGLVPRQAFADPGDVKPIQADEQPTLKIQPIEFDQMEPHQQSMLEAIYGPESGNRYDIRYGGAGSSGKTFDINGPHPNVPERREDGRVSTAAGAGQFLKSTWDEVTGGAPMSPGYQNAATWSLAQKNYNNRTGRDLDADLRENNGVVTPQIKAALAPTWEAFAKQGYGGANSPAQEKQQPQQGGVKPWYDKMAPTDVRGQERTMGNFLTSKDFVIPLLSGLGTMASSPSRYLGSAILQGLGGAAQAYQGVQKQQADIQGTQAGTEAVLANISKGAAVYGPSGQLMGYRVYINGKVTQIPATEFMRALRAGTPYQTAPDVGGMGSGPPAPAPTAEKKATETGGLAGAAPPSNGALTEPTAPAAPAPTPYRALTPEDQRLVEKNADGVTTSNPSAIGKDAKAYEEAASGASNSMINRPRSLSYAKSLSELPAKGPISSNVFSAEVTTPFIEYVNGLIHSIPGGGDINIAKPEDLANAETIRKISGLQANAQATQAGQHSWSALQSALATTPTQRNTPMGAANLMSDILMQEQLPIDYYSHLDIMKNYAQQKGLVTGEDQAKMLGTGTFKNFMDRYSQQQMQEKESLKQIFLTPLDYKNASGQPVKTSLMSYMISHGGQVPEALRPEIEKRYGTEIYRYFNTAGKAR